jgi:hypothetical protein
VSSVCIIMHWCSISEQSLLFKCSEMTIGGPESKIVDKSGKFWIERALITYLQVFSEVRTN